MLKIVDGLVVDPRVKVQLCPRLDHGPMPVVHGIVMHQTGGSTAAGTWFKYRNTQSSDRTGAHFLIDRDGSLYQTLQITRACAHVAPIKARCLAELRCTPADLEAFETMKKVAGNNWNGTYARAEGTYESKKSWPDRYPYNPDAIGIEVVGGPPKGSTIYENPTVPENDTVHWLVPSLLETLHIKSSEVFRHPTLSRKTESEASGVTW